MYDTMSLRLDTAPTMGSLLGTVGKKSLIDSINNELGSQGFFGSAADMFSAYRSSFDDYIIKPMIRVSETAMKMVSNFIHPDAIKFIIREEDLYVIPECMQLPILTYAPVRKLFEKGKIHGFGLNPEWLPEEDTVGRLLDNFNEPDCLANIEKNNGDLVLQSTTYSDDPDYSEDELDMFEGTRKFIDIFLKESEMDPTNYPEIRG